MTSDPSDRAQAATDAESAFMTLSHDLRLQILLALWDAPGFSLSFSELRKAVGERDSGSFNYHLSELQGHFVAKTDNGYELQYPGHRVLDAIQSGIFHEQVTVVAVGVWLRDGHPGLVPLFTTARQIVPWSSVDQGK